MFRNLHPWIPCLRSSNKNRFSAEETLLLEAVLNQLPGKKKSLFEKQLNCVFKVQRTIAGRMVRVFVSEQVQTIDPLGEEKCLAVVKYCSAGIPGHCGVVLHRGLLSTLEFRRPPVGQRTEIVSVMLEPDRYRCLSEVINRFEHGD